MNVLPDKVKLMNKHFTRGRGGREIKYIVRHHVAGISTTEQVWQTWQTRQASAHYIVEPDGTVGQLVWDRDTAWANANQRANQESLTIEHSNNGGAAAGWPISEATILEGARLAAALCRFYGLGRPEFGKNIRDHKEFFATSCPHHLAFGGKYHDQYMAEAQRFYDELVSGKTQEKKEEPALAGITLGGVSAAALNDAKNASQGAEQNSARTLGILTERYKSLINPKHGFTPEEYLTLIDAATWEQRKLSEAIARKLGLDPDQIVEDAIAEDRGRNE